VRTRAGADNWRKGVRLVEDIDEIAGYESIDLIP
jgi:hypothetical protein